MSLNISICGQQLYLHPEKAIYWKEKNILLIADPHFAKIGHFRKSGIAVPKGSSKADYIRLDKLLNTFPAKRLVVLGDFFHSDYNREIDQFKNWRNRWPALQIELVIGNHDLLSDSDYDILGVEILGSEYYCAPFRLVHEALVESKVDYYSLSGHLHPAVRIKGKGLQSLKLACFYFGEKGGILPAFGGFTGKKSILPKKTDRIFVVADAEVLELNPVG